MREGKGIRERGTCCIATHVGPIEALAPILAAGKRVEGLLTEVCPHDCKESSELWRNILGCDKPPLRICPKIPSLPASVQVSSHSPCRFSVTLT